MQPVRLLLLVVALLVPAAAAGDALAAPALDGTFSLSGKANRLTLGPDGNIWFTLTDSTTMKEFGKLTPGGAVTEFDSPGDVAMVGITAGPDGNLWATAVNKVIRIDPANPTAATAFTDNSIGTPQDITTGPDGHLWTASDANVIEVLPTTPTPTFDDHLAKVTGARGIAAGGDGNIWVADFGGPAIVKLDTAGTVLKATNVGGGPQQITPGATGQLGFTNPTANPQEFGPIDFAGNFNTVKVATGTDPFGIVFANDGAYWTAEFGANALGRLTLDGQNTQPIMFGANTGPRYLAKGPGDTLFVGLENGKAIARITGVSAPPPPTGTPPAGTPPATNPTVSPFVFAGVKLQLLTFRVSGRTVTIPIPCPAGFVGSCAGTILLQTASKVVAPKAAVTDSASKKKKRKKRLKLGSATFSIPAGRTANVKVKLNRSALKLLQKTKKLKTLATLTATAGGTTKTTTAKLTLKPPKSKKKRKR